MSVASTMMWPLALLLLSLSFTVLTLDPLITWFQYFSRHTNFHSSVSGSFLPLNFSVCLFFSLFVYLFIYLKSVSSILFFLFESDGGKIFLRIKINGKK